MLTSPSDNLDVFPRNASALGAPTGVATHGAFQEEAPFGGEMPSWWYTRPSIKEFRESTLINMLSVSHAHGAPDSEPGPWIDEVRVFAPHYATADKSRGIVWGFGRAAVVVAVVAASLWIGWPVEP